MAGDVVTLSGSAAAFASAAALFRAAGPLPVAPLQPPPAANIDVESVIAFTPHPQGSCTHLDSIVPVHPSARGCEECLRSGDQWVHLRICLTCGHVGCCDSSKNKHATGHFHGTQHPLIRSFEPGEDWGWCYVDELELEPDELLPAARSR